MLDVVFFWLTVLVHDDLRLIEKPLPELYHGYFINSYLVLLTDRFASMLERSIVGKDLFIFPLILDHDVAFIVYLPAPAIIVHGT